MIISSKISVAPRRCAPRRRAHTSRNERCCDGVLQGVSQVTSSLRAVRSARARAHNGLDSRSDGFDGRVER